MKKLLTKNVRKGIYLVCAAALPILVYYGVLDPEALPLILPLILALLNLSPDEVEAPKHSA